MCVAADGERVVGVAVYRVSENTFAGLQAATWTTWSPTKRQRSRGVGHALIAYIERARRAKRRLRHPARSTRAPIAPQAHKFYFREGMVITSFNFTKPLA